MPVEKWKNLLGAQLSGAVLYSTAAVQVERWVKLLGTVTTLCFRISEMSPSYTLTWSFLVNPWQVPQLNLSLLRGTCISLLLYTFSCCGCVYVCKTGARVQSSWPAVAAAGWNKKVQLAPGARRALLRYVPLAVCQKNTHTHRAPLN